jgi:nucleotide-binding universal stress UspA family protein
VSTEQVSVPRPHGPVVAGVDGSAGSWAAVRLAAWEATRRRVPLMIIYAYGEAIGYTSFDWGARTPGLFEAALADGGGASALVEQSHTASLVVVGSRGVGGFHLLSIGSVASQVAMHAYGPVIVVRPPVAVDAPPGEVVRGGPVVVGIDGSEPSAEALRFAADEADSRGTALVALYAWWLLPRRNLGPVTPSHYDPDQAREEAERMLAEAVSGWSQQYPDLRIERRTCHDINPAAALIDVSRTAGLVVVGCRGRGGFASLLLGSVGRSLVDHADCPVAVVHPHHG